MIFGYSRTSTRDQKNSLAEQERRLREAGADEVYIEERSGKSAANRPELQAMLARVRSGDVVVCTKLDRLCRDTRDFLNIEALVSERGATLRFLDQPIDTSDPIGQLIVTILAGFGQLEREMIASRVNEGLERAKREGKQLGRPQKDHESDPKYRGLLTLVESGESVTSAAKAVGISRSTAKRWLKVA